MSNQSTIVTPIDPAFFSEPVRYLSILAFVVLGFYPTFDRCIESTQDLRWHSENSFMVMMTDLFSDVQHSQNSSDDNDIDDVDFAPTHSMEIQVNSFSGKLQRIMWRNRLPDSITLRKFIPPPRA